MMSESGIVVYVAEKCGHVTSGTFGNGYSSVPMTYTCCRCGHRYLWCEKTHNTHNAEWQCFSHA